MIFGQGFDSPQLHAKNRVFTRFFLFRIVFRVAYFLFCQACIMDGTVLTRSEDYWFGCHTTGLIQVVSLAVDRLKAFEHGTV